MQSPTCMRSCVRAMGTILIPWFLLLQSCGDSGGATFQTTLVLENPGGQEQMVFATGEAVRMVVRIQNLTSAPQTITLPSSQFYDVVVVDQAGQEVWKLSHDMFFLTAITEWSFTPSETKTYAILWNETRNDGTTVATGQYSAQAFVATTENLLSQTTISRNETRSAPVPFTIQ